ncbi:multidrug ABC transporter ATP-binding and permease protein [Secundilactobacillus pentosiphilus]|uniref:Multidrug ABC transporter ATP-binding and permease protein n=1 Tax=Secundilactobacillus pentosiphilus TaxID=1714682 RepID=A0A1Z5ISX1_9LACO|nr:ABC transporter ATP-binding protein [Secundilactobacillus pentosiphilus]GAX04863.1 multidrug ABC transporter ATP-binding and permease protein [Secundilactobacillus pentosiphilus]
MADKQTESKSNGSLIEMFRFVFSKVLKKRWLLVLNIMALTVITLLQFVMPQIEQFIIDKVIPQQNFQWLIAAIAVLLLTAIVFGIFTYISAYYMTVMSQNAITELRNQLYEYLLKLDTSFFEASKTGDLMTRLTSDINNLQSLISANMLNMIGNLFTFVGVLALIFYINWEMALAVSLTFPLMFLVYRVFRVRIRTAFTNARRSQARMSNQMQQTLTQIDLIKSFNSEATEAQRFDHFADTNRKDMISAGQNQAIFSPLIDGINTLGIAIVLALGAYFIIKGQLTVGQLVAYLSYVAMVQSPIQAFTRLLNQLQQSLVSYGRIQSILQEQPQVLNAADAKPFPKFSKGIVLSHVNFNYDATKHPGTHDATLKDISFTIPYGKTTALVGRSGSGKTTITRLIDRFYDLESGSITFDDLPIQAIDISSLRQHIAIVSQDIFIIDGSIRNNILYGRPDATDEEVWEVAKLADLDTFIRELPDQLDTQVGERGVKLSGGQKQRVSIARALLKNAPIIILDEATASLDNQSEKAIQHALNNLLESRTSLVIAHRLSTIHDADQIIVLENGQVVETGTHESLLKADGAYKKLYDAQFE